MLSRYFIHKNGYEINKYYEVIGTLITSTGKHVK